jgi:chloride channel protein, CIC family
MPAAQPTPQLGGAAYQRLILLGAAIGIPAALVAALFLALVHDLEHWLWHDLPEALDYSSPPWFLVVGLPVVGALIVVAARLFLPGDGGHSPLHGLSASPTPPAHAASVALAGLGSLAFGAVLGPELPVVTLGAAIGVAATWFVRLGERETAVLSTAGGTSAISALFGGPIVAGLLVLESGLPMGAALLPFLLPGLVAAAVGYLIFVGFGDWGGLGTPGLVVPDLPPYEGVHAYDLAVALVVGVLGAVILAAARVLATRTDGLRERLGLPALLIAGGLAVGVLAELADLLGADSQDVLFSGQASVPDVVAEDSTKVIVILLAAKFLAYGVSLGCGFRGGPIFPAVVLGIALTSLAIVWFDVSPTLAVAVGAAAGTVAQTRLLIAPLLFAALLVGTEGLDTIPAAVLATVAAWLTTTALDRRLAPAPVG